MIASGVFNSCAAAARASRQTVQLLSAATSSIAGFTLADLTDCIGVGSTFVPPKLTATRSVFGTLTQHCASVGLPSTREAYGLTSSHFRGQKQDVRITAHQGGASIITQPLAAMSIKNSRRSGFLARNKRQSM